MAGIPVTRRQTSKHGVTYAYSWDITWITIMLRMSTCLSIKYSHFFVGACADSIGVSPLLWRPQSVYVHVGGGGATVALGRQWRSPSRVEGLRVRAQRLSHIVRQYSYAVWMTSYRDKFYLTPAGKNRAGMSRHRGRHVVISVCACNNVVYVCCCYLLWHDVSATSRTWSGYAMKNTGPIRSTCCEREYARKALLKRISK